MPKLIKLAKIQEFVKYKNNKNDSTKLFKASIMILVQFL